MRIRVIVACALFAGLFALYAGTAAPDVTFQDSGELITAAYTLGIPHSPGSPLWCLLSHAFTWLPIGTPAFRVHLFCGAAAALACACTYLLVLTLLHARDAAEFGLWPHLAGIVSALCLAQAPGFWDKAVQAELYTLHALFIVLILHAFAKWHAAERAGDESHRTHLVRIALLFGLGAANYMALLYFAPVLALAAVARKPALLRDARLIALCALAFVAGMSLYLYLPLRSMADPPIDWDNPETLQGFLFAMSRRRWGGTFQFTSEMMQYVRPWLASVRLPGQFGVPALGLAGAGLLFLLFRQPLLAIVLALCFLVHAALMAAMQCAQPHLWNSDFFSEYTLTDFHIPLYVLVALLPGIGLYAAVWLLKCARLVRRPAAPVWLALGLATAAVALVPVFSTHLRRCDYRGFTQGRVYGEELVQSVESNAWVIASTDSSAFILMYLKFCVPATKPFSVLTVRPAFYDALAEAGGRSAPVAAEAIARLVLAEPGRVLDPLLNQSLGTGTPAPAVYFVRPDHDELVRASVVPAGMLFRVGAADSYSLRAQEEYWRSILPTPAFALGADAKPEFRKNMADTLEYHAWWHFKRRDYLLAARLYEAALDYVAAPRTRFYAPLSVCAAEQGDMEKTLRYSDLALAGNPRDKTALKARGSILTLDGDYPAALECYRRVLAIDPTDPEATQSILQIEQAQ